MAALSQKDTHEGNSKTAVNQNIVGAEREFHSEETSTYWLPKDDEEQKRLTGI